MKTTEKNLCGWPEYLRRDFEVTSDVVTEGDCKVLSISVVDITTPAKHHYSLRFNVDWATPERIEWLGDILARDLADNIWEVKKNQRQYIQYAAYQFGKSIGLSIQKLG